MKKKLYLLGLLALPFFLYCGWHTYAPTPATSSEMQPSTLKHLGIIMDGNRRWARKSGLLPWLGHRKGVEPVKATIEFCLEQGIEHLTLYAFSLENFKRSQEELDFLFNMLAREIASEELDNLFKKGVKVRFFGDAARFPSQLVELIKDTEKKTEKGGRLNLNLLFCYGGRQELFAAAQKLARAVKQGLIDPTTLSESEFEACLWTGDIPVPELIIRTGGAQRLSNFLPYQSAYSELYFSTLFWPEMTEKELKKAIAWFSQQTRNTGK